MADITLFVSHSAADAELAKRIVHAAEKALAIPARMIRCSSVDGYRLPAGSDTDEAIRDEIFQSRAFIALLTPHSLESTWVLFEVGARWGAKKHLFPVVAGGATTTAVEGPMAGLNTLNAASPPQFLQLLQELGTALDLPLQPMGSFQEAVNVVVAAAAEVRTPRGDGERRRVSPGELTDDEIVALLQDWMGRRTSRENTSPIYFADVEADVGIPKTRLNRLLEIAARKFNYVPERKGDNLVLFKQIPNRLRSS
jgi:hypothetical protein